MNIITLLNPDRREPEQSVAGFPNAGSAEQLGGADNDKTYGTPLRHPQNGIRLTHEDYTIAWICPLHIELAAARAMLDNQHENLPNKIFDSNTYTLGSIGRHNVAIACLPAGHYGSTNAAVVARNVMSSFPHIKIKLVVGIGGGVPVPGKTDIRLGDIVVGNRVIQFDFGKATEQGFHRTSDPVRPPQDILTAVTTLWAQHENDGSRIPDILLEMIERYPSMHEYMYPAFCHDQLFESEYPHDPSADSCRSCNKSKLVPRHSRTSHNPQVHQGTIASGNQVMKNAKTRDLWANEENVMCFEMEAAGLIEHFPCIVIRGICDYADSHKNKDWQRYAAATAAAYAKELLCVISPIHADKTQAAASPRSQSQNQQLPSTVTQQREIILDSLRFNQIDSRYMTIKGAHTHTCEWLLSSEEYRDWIDNGKLHDHHGLLWIKGKPGTGKSTLMKFILHRMQKLTANYTLLYFFFNARGSDLEKSTIGMYRSLLVHIFDRFPTLQNALDSSHFTTLSKRKKHDWGIQELKDLFQQVILDLNDSPIVCLIDALDECDEQQIRDMVSFFSMLGDPTRSNNHSFRVCLSSRHYPHITMKKGLNLVLENHHGHEQDIIAYIQSELTIEHGQLAERVRYHLLQKASGVFMWVVLVVDILNKEYDEGQVHNIEQRLIDIPGDLHELFRSILCRDSTHRSELVLCLQWILFAKRPLKPEELYFAIRSGTQNEMFPKWNPTEITIDHILRFILNASKGLAEATKPEFRTIQFIHESVRDFLLKDGLEIIGLEKNPEGQSHERLKQCCLDYCGIDTSKFQQSANSLFTASLAVYVLDVIKFPFFNYAISNLLYHADKAAGHGISQAGFLRCLNVYRWIYFNNISHFKRSKYALDTRFLYILAEANAGNLIRIYSSDLSGLEKKGEQYGCPMSAAMIGKCHEAVQALKANIFDYSSQIGVHPVQNGQITTTLHEPIFPTPMKKRTILSYAAAYGDPEIFAYLMEKENTKIDLADEQGRNPLSYAAEGGHVAIIKLLIENGKVSLDSKDISGKTPLLYALRRNNMPVIEFLVQTGRINLDVRDNSGETPLAYAARWGLESVVQLLIKTGRVNLNSKDITGQTPLMSAVRSSREGVVQKLLRTGQINRHSTDNAGRTALFWANHTGHPNILALLQFDHVNASTVH